MNQVFKKLRLLKSFIIFLKDPRKTEQVFQLGDIGSASGSSLVAQTIEYVTSFEAFNRIYEERYFPPLGDLEKLSLLSDSTLGNKFANHMKSNGLSVDFFPTKSISTITDYLVDRVRRTHDIWHVLTGFDTSVPGELGLQAFALAQFRSPLAALIVAGGFLHVLIYNQAIFEEVVKNIFTGYQMGKDANFVLGYRIEDHWADSLEKVRAELNIKPVL